MGDSFNSTSQRLLSSPLSQSVSSFLAQVPRFNQLLHQTACRTYDCNMIDQDPRATEFRVQDLNKLWILNFKSNKEKFGKLKEEGENKTQYTTRSLRLRI